MKSPDSPLLCPCCAGLHSYADRDTLIQHLAYDHSSAMVARDFGFMIAEKQKAIPIEKIDAKIKALKEWENSPDCQGADTFKVGVELELLEELKE